MESVPVDVLCCAACGADVPLGEGDVARCVHCGAAVPLPARYVELRRAQHDDTGARERAESLFAKLDSPPWLVTRVLSAVLDQPMPAFWLFFGVPVGLSSIFAGLALDARLHPASWVTTAVIFGAIFVLTFLPRSLGIYANRRTSARQVLLAGLVARPPRLPGGPAECRNCGAPLDVPPGATVARCAYCRAESAVKVHTPFLARVQKSARSVAHTVEEAANIDARERGETRRTLLRELRRYVLLIGTFGTLFAIYMWDWERSQARGDDGPPAIGLLALVLEAILLIATMIYSLARADERQKAEARLRREANGLPGWVRVAGPFGVWVVLWIVRGVVW